MCENEFSHILVLYSKYHLLTFIFNSNLKIMHVRLTIVQNFAAFDVVCLSDVVS